ncbi:hypothetical protein [Isoptericola sp. NPDC057391]|uniref:hypothetical protein n=1 Tax=Isoptericola sp. NPDC057391 TaxID=3346117 RepID=UPI003644F232
MTRVPAAEAARGPDADLLEYLLVAVPTAERLEGVAAAVHGLLRARPIRLVDAVLLRRARGQAAVTVHAAGDVAQLARLAELEDPRVRLSAHDIALAAVAVEPCTCVLLLLVEDLWAATLARAARDAGGRVLGGERLGPDRVRTAGRRSAVDADRRDRADLLVRGPATSVHPELAVDPAAQLRMLAELVDRGVLTLDQYEVQRRRVLDG